MEVKEDAYTFKITFAIPKWIWSVLGYSLIFVTGFGLGVMAVKIENKQALKESYLSGYDEGRSSCTEPSRLERGLGSASRWLSRPGDK